MKNLDIELVEGDVINYNEIIKVLSNEMDLPIETKGLLPEVIADVLIGTRQIRQGAKPSMEFILKLYSYIKAQIEKEEPIQIGIPIGPKKPGANFQIDLAEVWALKVLQCIRRKVTSKYTPGVTFTLFMENLSAFIFEPDVEGIDGGVTNYVNNFMQLTRVLGVHNFVNVWLESESTQLQVMQNLIAQIEPVIHTGLIDGGHNWNQKLEKMGWKGKIGLGMVVSYYNQFRRQYPMDVEHETYKRISTYLATAWARGKLHLRDIGKEYISGSFAGMIQGVDPSMQQKLYYRSVPLHISKLNCPFWRAKGYLVEEEDEYRTKLSPWGNGHIFQSHSVTLARGGETVKIQTDIKID